MLPLKCEILIELLPGPLPLRRSDKEAPIDKPIFVILPPTEDYHLEAVRLHIDEGGKDEHAVGHVGVLFDPGEEASFIDLVALVLDERLGQALIDEHAQQFPAPPGAQEILDHIVPGGEGRDELVDMESGMGENFRSEFVPEAASDHAELIFFLDFPVAVFAFVVVPCKVIGVESERAVTEGGKLRFVGEDEELTEGADWAWNKIMALVALEILLLDPGKTPDRRAAHLHDLPVVVGIRQGAVPGELYLVPLPAGGRFIAIDIVQEGSLNRLLTEAGGAIGADDVKDSARVRLAQDLVVAVLDLFG